jgi:hypothetical protein
MLLILISNPIMTAPDNRAITVFNDAIKVFDDLCKDPEDDLWMYLDPATADSIVRNLVTVNRHMKAMPPAVVPEKNKVNYVEFCDRLLQNINALRRLTKCMVSDASLMGMKSNLHTLNCVLKHIASA